MPPTRYTRWLPFLGALGLTSKMLPTGPSGWDSALAVGRCQLGQWPRKGAEAERGAQGLHFVDATTAVTTGLGSEHKNPSSDFEVCLRPLSG